jgi:hypothetical protein|tara:strand:+ start:357 stop:1607 length:1251 start_codon:yes stop_codon:yes gene_type:complete
MPTFTIKQESTISLSAAEMTAMQEKATAFILMQAFQKNVKYSSVDDIVKHKETKAGLKKIFTKGSKSIFSYESPVDIKSPEGEWLENFYQQQKKMLLEYSSPGWTVFNREGGFMDFITNLIRRKFGISKKDSWNPADIWLIKKKDVFRKKIEEELKGAFATQTIVELNAIMRAMFKDEEVVGISLKKISGKIAKYDKINVDEKFFEKLEKRNGEYAYSFSKANLKLGWSKSKNSFETADANIWIKDNAGKEIYKFQLKPNQTSKFSNLKFEPNALGGAAFLGKAPLDLIQKLVERSPGVPNKLYNKETRNNAYYPKSYNIFVKEIKEYSKMFDNIKKAKIDIGTCRSKEEFIANISKAFNTKTPYVAHTKLMLLHFLDQLMKIKSNKRDDLLTDIIFLAAKQGRTIFDFGPFGKLY